jgi:prevent-host-death family protein
MASQIRRTVIRVTELHRRLGQIIRRVALSDEHFVIEKGGLPVVVLLSMPEYERLVRDRKLVEFERFARAVGEEAERQGLTEEQLMAELEEDKKAAYQEMYGEIPE